MNKLCIQIFFIAIFVSSSLFSQIRISSDSRRIFTEIKSLLEHNPNLEFDQIEHSFPINKISGRYYLSTLGKVSKDFNSSHLPAEVMFGSQINTIATLRIPVDQLHVIELIEEMDYLEVSPRIVPELARVLLDTRVDSVHGGLGMNNAYTGKDVIIGIQDWGFDYMHPMFYDTSLSETRILASWDQFRTAGNPPAGFSYGTEIVGSTDLTTFQSDTACSYYDYATHGSHVAGIAGGSGAGLKLTGMAFESNFIFSQFYLDAASSIDAVSWMKTFAEKKGRSLVVNMSWGLYHLGPFDGTSLLSQALDAFADEGVTIVTSNGNNGGEDFHIKHNFNNDTIASRIMFYGYNLHPSMWGQSISMWAGNNVHFSTAIEVYDRSSKILLANSPFYLSATSSAFLDTMLITGSDTIFYNIAIDSSYATNNKAHMRLRVKNTNTNLAVRMLSASDQGQVHYWNVVELSNGAGNWGMPFSSFLPGDIVGDSEYSIGEPACTDRVISVGAHSSEVRLPNGTVVNGGLASFSSEGPTVDERTKPDITAPGVSVLSSISSFTSASYTADETVTFKGKAYDFSRFSGTSMSSPAVTGIVALMLDARPSLKPDHIKTILKNTARTDNQTGVIPSAGSMKWGWGKVTASAAIKELEKYTDISTLERESAYSVHPNPFSNILNIEHKNAKEGVEISILSIQGKLLFTSSLIYRENIMISSEFLPKGMYLIRIKSNKETITRKIIKE